MNCSSLLIMPEQRIEMVFKLYHPHARKILLLTKDKDTITIQTLHLRHKTEMFFNPTILCHCLSLREAMMLLTCPRIIHALPPAEVEATEDLTEVEALVVQVMLMLLITLLGVVIILSTIRL